MSVQRIASRYAKSLIDLASDNGKLERIKEDVDAFRTAADNRDFYLLMKSPIVQAAKKMQVVKALFEGKFDPLTLAFLQIIINKGREAYLPEVAREFETQYKEIRQISTVTITTATALDEATIGNIKSRIVSSGATKANLELIVRTDPSIIGGFRIEFDDKLYDASISRKLDELRKEFSTKHYLNLVSNK